MSWHTFYCQGLTAAFRYLSIPDLLNARQTCRLWNKYVLSQDVGAPELVKIGLQWAPLTWNHWEWSGTPWFQRLPIVKILLDVSGSMHGAGFEKALDVYNSLIDKGLHPENIEEFYFARDFTKVPHGSLPSKFGNLEGSDTQVCPVFNACITLAHKVHCLTLYVISDFEFPSLQNNLFEDILSDSYPFQIRVHLCSIDNSSNDRITFIETDLNLLNPTSKRIKPETPSFKPQVILDYFPVHSDYSSSE